MKKTKKALLSLSSIGIVGIISPTICVSCSCSSNKTQIDSLEWTLSGKYSVYDTEEETITEFKNSNLTKKDGGILPDDIYDNVKLSCNGEGAARKVVVTANNDSNNYQGTVTLEINVLKVILDTIPWTAAGDYSAQNSDEEVINEFIKNNKTEENGGILPDDIYENISINCSGEGSQRQIEIVALDSSVIYGGRTFINIWGKKADITNYKWNTTPHGYHAAMTNDEIAAKFKEKNPAGQQQIPEDIYSNINVQATGNGTNRTITLYALGESNYYIGSFSFDVTVNKCDISTLNWTNSGTYTRTMNWGEVKNEFLSNNEAGKNGIPDDIYNHVTLTSTSEDPQQTWTITIKLINGSDTIYANTETTVTIDTSLVNVSLLPWSTSGNNYSSTLTDEQYVAEFKNVNKAGQNGLPSNIYDSSDGVDITVTAGTGYSDRQLLIKAKDTSEVFTGQTKIFIYINKTDIGTTTYWTTPTNCTAPMTNAEISAEFIRQNPEGENEIPTGIYDEINVITFGEGKNRTIVVYAKATSNLYRGIKSFTISTQNFNVQNYSWENRGVYTVPMNNDQIINEFKQINKAGERGLPANVYDYVSVNITNLSNDTKTITLTCTSGDYYDSGSTTLTITTYAANVLYYWYWKEVKREIVKITKIYKLPDNFDPNIIRAIDDNGQYIWDIPIPNVQQWEGDHWGDTITGKLENPRNVGTLTLQSIDTNVTEFTDRFATHIDNLEIVDFYGCSNITKFGNKCFSECISLHDLRHLEGLSNVTSIGNNFMEFCYRLSDIDLSKFTSLKTIGDYFMQCCTGLTTIDLDWLNNLNKVGDYFLAYCNNLTTLDLSNITSTTLKIGQRFLFGCNGLYQIKLPSATTGGTNESFVDALRWGIANSDSWLVANNGKFIVPTGETTAWQNLLGYSDEQAAAHIQEA